MNKTQNYHLPQWVRDDQIRMDDFNAAFAAVDAALKSGADSIAAILQSKLCRIACGSYTGTGTGGSAHPSTLSCGFYPVLLIITTMDQYNNINRVVAMRGISQFTSGVGNRHNNITWNDRGVSWYPSMADDTYYNACDVQLNTAGTVYQYLLLGLDQ